MLDTKKRDFVYTLVFIFIFVFLLSNLNDISLTGQVTQFRQTVSRGNIYLPPGGNYQPGQVTITLTDPNDFIHPPGSPFQTTVQITNPGVTANIFAQWIDASGNPLTNQQTIFPGNPTVLRSPRSGIGYQGLVFTSDNPFLALLPQDPGFPSSEYGYAILPPPQQRVLDRNSQFGTVHTNKEDPYLRGYSKTKTWNTHSPTSFANKLRELQNIYYLVELPVINGRDWDVNDSLQINQSQLDRFGNRLGSYLDALINANVNLEYMQFGIEENGGGDWPQENYTEYNLRKKMERVDQEFAARGLTIKKIFSMRGFNYAEFNNFFASQAGTHFDIVGVHPYKWPDFPTPEGWLVNHINTIKTMMNNNPQGPQRMWFTEIGLPHRGRRDPNAFFGYPNSGAQVPGASREYAAVYIIKAHAEALSTGDVEKIFWYNYYDRDGSVNYAEDHFGARTYYPTNKKEGPIKQMYMTYVNMISHLDDNVFNRKSNPRSNVYVYEFVNRNPNIREGAILAWVSPTGSETLSLGALRSGLTTNNINNIVDMYGVPTQIISGQSITVNENPIYVSFTY